MRKLRVFGLMWVLAIGGIFCASFAQKNDIVLSNEPLQIKPEGFYIDSVTDDRTEKVAIAMLAVAIKGGKPEMQAADLEGGAAKAVNSFISKNLTKNVSVRPVNISIKDFKLTETVLPNGSIDGRIQLSLSFGQQKNYGIQQLVGYKGGLHYIRPLANSGVIETQLRVIIKSGLVYFNNWMLSNLDSNPKLAKTVTFSFTNYADKTEGDTIYYSPSRPLTWNDFQSKVRPPGPFSASVMPSFGYDLDQEIKNGVIKVNLAIKTYVAKSDCWVGNTRSSYALNHEQRHFDIARIITRQYQQKILSAGLTPDTYEAFISMQYLDSYRAMNVMQKAYDSETRHGGNETAQLIWNKKIDAMLVE